MVLNQDIRHLRRYVWNKETKNRSAVIPITVVAFTKDQGPQGIDVLKVYSSKLVNSIESKKQEIGLLKDYKASIRLKENNHPRYIQAIRLPIHILPIVVSKLKMILQGILEKGTRGGSDWVSPVVAIKKTDGDIRIFSDYKKAWTTWYVRIRFLYQVSKPPVTNSQIWNTFRRSI